MKGHWPQMTFDPTLVEVTNLTLCKYYCVQVPCKYIRVCGYSDWKIWPKGQWPIWTLDDIWTHISSSRMCDSTQGLLCLNAITYIKACEYSDPFSKTVTKYQWTLNDLWPCFYWDTCVNLLKDHCVQVQREYIYERLWIQWSILQKMITYTLHTLHIQNKWSHSLFWN